MDVFWNDQKFLEEFRMRYFFLSFVILGLILVSYSIISYQPSFFVPFNWMALVLVVLGGLLSILLFKYPRLSQYLLFATGLLIMLNAYFYFKECSNLKGFEVIGGFLISSFSLFLR